MPRAKKKVSVDDSVVEPTVDVSSPPTDDATPSLTKRASAFIDVSEHFVQRAVDLERQLLFSLNPTKWPSIKQLRHSGRVFSIRERRLLLAAGAIIAVALIWIGLGRVVPHIQPLPANGGTYTEGIIGQPQAINPLYAASATDADLTRLVYAGLFRYDANLNPVADLAASYTVSSDGRVYTVVLKNNLVWHDGEPLTVDDVVFTFTNATAHDTASVLADNFQNIVVEKIDDHTVQFTLKDPYPAFLNLLTTGIIPQHVWGKVALADWPNSDFNLRPVGAGDWQFDALARNADGSIKQISLIRAPARDGETPPFINQLVFKFYPDDTSAETALSSRDIEGLAGLNTTDLGTVSSRWHLKNYDLSYPAVTAVFFNAAVNAPTSDANVRRALDAAIDRPALLQKLGGSAVAVSGPFPPSILTTPAMSAGDPATLLEAAGWTRVGALWKNKQNDTLSVVLSVIDREPDRDVGTFIQNAWQHLGVDVKIDLASPATADTIEQTLLKPRSYQALLFTQVYGPLPDPYPFWHSSERFDPGLNFSEYTNKDADDLIEKARRATSASDRNTALTDLTAVINKDAPAIFLFSPVRHYIISDDVEGVTINNVAVPADRFNALNQWYVKTRWQFVP